MFPVQKQSRVACTQFRRHALIAIDQLPAPPVNVASSAETSPVDKPIDKPIKAVPDEDLDLDDDICPVCDGDCTCNTPKASPVPVATPVKSLQRKPNGASAKSRKPGQLPLDVPKPDPLPNAALKATTPVTAPRLPKTKMPVADLAKAQVLPKPTTPVGKPRTRTPKSAVADDTKTLKAAARKASSTKAKELQIKSVKLISAVQPTKRSLIEEDLGEMDLDPDLEDEEVDIVDIDDDEPTPFTPTSQMAAPPTALHPGTPFPTQTHPPLFEDQSTPARSARSGEQTKSGIRDKVLGKDASAKVKGGLLGTSALQQRGSAANTLPTASETKKSSGKVSQTLKEVIHRSKTNDDGAVPTRGRPKSTDRQRRLSSASTKSAAKAAKMAAVSSPSISLSQASSSDSLVTTPATTAALIADEFTKAVSSGRRSSGAASRAQVASGQAAHSPTAPLHSESESELSDIASSFGATTTDDDDGQDSIKDLVAISGSDEDGEFASMHRYYDSDDDSDDDEGHLQDEDEDDSREGYGYEEEDEDDLDDEDRLDPVEREIRRLQQQQQQEDQRRRAQWSSDEDFYSGSEDPDVSDSDDQVSSFWKSKSPLIISKRVSFSEVPVNLLSLPDSFSPKTESDSPEDQVTETADDEANAQGTPEADGTEEAMSSAEAASADMDVLVDDPYGSRSTTSHVGTPAEPLSQISNGSVLTAHSASIASTASSPSTILSQVVGGELDQIAIDTTLPEHILQEAGMYLAQDSKSTMIDAPQALLSAKFPELIASAALSSQISAAMASSAGLVAATPATIPSPNIMVPPVPAPPTPTPAPAASVSFDFKKSHIGPNGEITTTTETMTFQRPQQNASSKSSSSSSLKKKPAAPKPRRPNTSAATPPGFRPSAVPHPNPSNINAARLLINPLAATSGIPQSLFAPAANLLPAPGSSMAFPTTTQQPTASTPTGTQNQPPQSPAQAQAQAQAAVNLLLKQRPVPLLGVNPMAAAAAAMAATAPGTLLALTQLRKRELEKLWDGMNLDPKVRAMMSALNGINMNPFASFGLPSLAGFPPVPLPKMKMDGSSGASTSTDPAQPPYIGFDFAKVLEEFTAAALANANLDLTATAAQISAANGKPGARGAPSPSSDKSSPSGSSKSATKSTAKVGASTAAAAVPGQPPLSNLSSSLLGLTSLAAAAAASTSASASASASAQQGSKLHLQTSAAPSTIFSAVAPLAVDLPVSATLGKAAAGPTENGTHAQAARSSTDSLVPVSTSSSISGTLQDKKAASSSSLTESFITMDDWVDTEALDSDSDRTEAPDDKSHLDDNRWERIPIYAYSSRRQRRMSIGTKMKDVAKAVRMNTGSLETTLVGSHKGLEYSPILKPYKSPSLEAFKFKNGSHHGVSKSVSNGTQSRHGRIDKPRRNGGLRANGDGFIGNHTPANPSALLSPLWSAQPKDSLKGIPSLHLPGAARTEWDSLLKLPPSVYDE
ncbi:uncharacterized protein BJ171DRAFT_471751 [Polychytrium aggregatum]|uniref:uncharacterized protein n=1 Tax=Polychytrium aggregatum TaxID=110093 RepID=UPI0022FDDC7E|nr:uncharacterized protein BJ171DRAFT_471751 [Polychytrium aggregatum]KAI9208777.1 hypothetical protein BJ171DRAFT_471751 [Polychytrium aggregatum]